MTARPTELLVDYSTDGEKGGLTKSPSETRDSHDSRAVTEVRLVSVGEVLGGFLAVQALSERGAPEDTGSGTVEDGQDLGRQLKFKNEG
jgi:hypothetical protein